MGYVKRLSALLSALTLTVAANLVAAPPAAAAPAPVRAARAAPATPAEVAPAYHVVRPGETIRSIAAAHGLRRRQLRAWNEIRRPNEPSADGVLNLARPRRGGLSGWRSRIETITPGTVNWDPASRCPVPPADLRRVWVTYIDFYGASHQGSIVVRLHRYLSFDACRPHQR